MEMDTQSNELDYINIRYKNGTAIRIDEFEITKMLEVGETLSTINRAVRLAKELSKLKVMDEE